MECINIISCLLILCLFAGSTTASVTFEFSNKCSHTVWPAILSGANSSPLPQSGFKLPPNSTSSLSAPPAWSGRIWGRSFCSVDPYNRFSCLTGDCSTYRVSCDGASGAPPATLFEITLGSGDRNDFYDVSLVDGYNLPIGVVPVGGTGDCRKAGCRWDLDRKCPKELAVRGPGGAVVACKSACKAFGDPRYCCSGAYGTPATCGPSNYSEIFKTACPTAYSYAYDDRSSTFTCAGPANYAVTFCP